MRLITYFIFLTGALACSQSATQTPPIDIIDTGDTTQNTDFSTADSSVDLVSDLNGEADTRFDADIDTCESPLLFANFDSWECDPICDTGCTNGEACVSGSNPVVGNVTSCHAPSAQVQDEPCRFDGTIESLACAPKHGCDGYFCAKYCAVDEDCPDGNYTCKISENSIVGRCLSSCELWPAENTCPFGTHCFYYSNLDENRCIGFQRDRRVGLACTNIQDCSEGEFCWSSICRKKCRNESECSDIEFCGYFEGIKQWGCWPD